MRAGELRHRIAILTRSLEESPFGKKLGAPVVTATVWGEVKTLTGQELLRAQQVVSEATHQIKIRYYQGLTRKNALRWTDPKTNTVHEYDINAIDDIDQRHIEMVIIAKEAT